MIYSNALAESLLTYPLSFSDPLLQNQKYSWFRIVESKNATQELYASVNLGSCPDKSGFEC